MTDYYVDSGASGTNAGTSWTNAWTSFWSVPTLTASDTVYVASRHVEASVSADKTLTLPSSGAGARIISVTTGTTTYATGAQVKTTGGAYDLTLDGSCLIYGVTFDVGDDFYLGADTNEGATLVDCTIKLSNAGIIQIYESAANRLINCTVDLTNDASGASAAVFYGGAGVTYGKQRFAMFGGSITNASNRTGTNGQLLYGISGYFAGVDLSSMPSSMELVAYSTDCHFVGCKMPSSYTVMVNLTASSNVSLINCTNGALADHLQYYQEDYMGTVTLDQGVTLDSGATADDGVGGTQQFSLKLVSDADCSNATHMATDWFYVWNDTTGSRNLDIYVGAAETLDNAEIWADYLYLGTDNSEQLSFATTQRSGGAAATYTTTGGTWSGTGAPANSYYLRSAVTIQEKGWVMGRVCVGKASLTAYVDPRIVLS